MEIQHSGVTTGEYICNIPCLWNVILIWVFLKLSKNFQEVKQYFPVEYSKTKTYFSILIFKELNALVEGLPNKSLKNKNANGY